MDNHTMCMFSPSAGEVILSNIQLVCLFFFSLIGFLMNACELCLIPKISIWPINVRMFLINVNVAALFTTSYGLVRFIAYEVHSVTLFNPAGSIRKISIGSCHFLESLLVISAAPLCYSMLAIAVERWLVSTNRMKPSEDKPNKLVIVTVAMSWLMALPNLTVLFMESAPQAAEGNTCFCAFLAMVGPIFMVLVAIFLLQELAVICMFFYVLHLNRTKLHSFCLDTVSHSLSERFEIRGTIRITEMALPTVFCQTLIWTLIVISAAFAIVNPDVNALYYSFSPRAAAVLQLINNLIIMTAALHPVVLFSCSDVLRKKFHVHILRRAQVEPATSQLELQPVAQGDRHIQIMNSIWETRGHVH